MFLIRRLVVAATLALSIVSFAVRPQPSDFVICGYVFPHGAQADPGAIDAGKITRINYAFATIEQGKVTITAPDAANLAALTALRKQNPALAVLISLGGWLGSGGFSDAALTAKSRSTFIDSVVELLNHYDLDGVDLDWEFPGSPGAGHEFRSEDKQNFTLLLKELRARLSEAKRSRHGKLLLTIAAGASLDYLEHTEMRKVAPYVDDVNLMAYDYYEPSADRTTGNHAPLFTDPADPKKESADASVKAFLAAGAPARKIVLGVPFYSHVWGQVDNLNHGLFQPGKAIQGANTPYGSVVDSMLSQGYERFWDAASKVPYLYSSKDHQFVSYEDPQSLAEKCAYVRARRLGGISFWSYFDDPSGQLLGTIDRNLSGP